MIRLGIIILLLAFAYVSKGQEKLLACNALSCILKEGDFLKEKAKDRIILVDTFGFFSPQCSGLYGSSNVEVRNDYSLTKTKKQELKNLLWVVDISTGKENALRVVITHQASNEVFAYWLSITGKNIKVSEKERDGFIIDLPCYFFVIPAGDL